MLRSLWSSLTFRLSIETQTKQNFTSNLSRLRKVSFPIDFFSFPSMHARLTTPQRLLVLTSIGVARFVSPIFWYRSFSVSALSPCHGNEPRRKYMNMWPSASKSSRRDCSLPMWVLIDMYLAVPVSDLCSRYGICLLVSKSMYSLARPKSVGETSKESRSWSKLCVTLARRHSPIICIILSRLFELLPIRKFSGFTSL